MGALSPFTLRVIRSSLYAGCGFGQASSEWEWGRLAHPLPCESGVTGKAPISEADPDPLVVSKGS